MVAFVILAIELVRFVIVEVTRFANVAESPFVVVVAEMEAPSVTDKVPLTVALFATVKLVDDTAPCTLSIFELNVSDDEPPKVPLLLSCIWLDEPPGVPPPTPPDDMPREDVATRSYVPELFPSNTFPYVGAVDVPVPP